jgi:competence protein ComEA
MKHGRKILTLFVVVAVFMTFVPGLWAGETGKININTATVEEIANLEKIGPKYAERIVQYRKDHGPFDKPEDITKVKGIGPKTFELNKNKITVD